MAQTYIFSLNWTFDCLFQKHQFFEKRISAKLAGCENPLKKTGHLKSKTIHGGSQQRNPFSQPLPISYKVNSFHIATFLNSYLKAKTLYDRTKSRRKYMEQRGSLRKIIWILNFERILADRSRKNAFQFCKNTFQINSKQKHPSNVCSEAFHFQ